MVSVRPARRRERADALSLLLEDVPPAERAHRVEECLDAEANGEFSLDGLLIAESNGAVRGSLLVLVQADGSAAVWPPRVHSGDDGASLADALLAECLRHVAAHQCWMAQALLDVTAAGDRATLVRNGFESLARLRFLQRDLSEPPPHPGRDYEVLTFREELRPRFESVLQATYAGTRDCPVLNEVRSVAEALRSHQHSGASFRPEGWLLFRQQEQDLGLVLTADHPAQSAREIVYMGVAASHRGRGHGRDMLLHALHRVRTSGCHSVFLAVDDANSFARNVYDELRFEEVTQRVVLAWFPRRDPTPCSRAEAPAQAGGMRNLPENS